MQLPLDGQFRTSISIISVLLTSVFVFVEISTKISIFVNFVLFLQTFFSPINIPSISFIENHSYLSLFLLSLTSYLNTIPFSNQYQNICCDCTIKLQSFSSNTILLCCYYCYYYYSFLFFYFFFFYYFLFVLFFSFSSSTLWLYSFETAVS